MMLSYPELRAALKLPPDQDDEVKDLTQEVIDLWETATGRKWNRRAGHVERIELNHDRLTEIWLELGPVETISKVEEKTVGDDTWDTLDVSEYELVTPANPNLSYSLRKYGAFFLRNVRVTYDGGFTATPTGIQVKTPRDIRRALMVQAQFMRARFAPEKLAIQSQNFEGGNGVFLKADLHPYFAMLARERGRKV